MKKASEYRQHADECRALAKGMPDGESRDQLLRMAETWDRLAQDSARVLPIAPDEAARRPATE